MIEIKKKLLSLAFLSIFLLMMGGLGYATAKPEIPGDGLQNGDLDRDRDRDRDGDCPSPSDGEDGGDPNQGDGKRNCYGPIEGLIPKMAMYHWALEWNHQYRWDPAPG